MRQLSHILLFGLFLTGTLAAAPLAASSEDRMRHTVVDASFEADVSQVLTLDLDGNGIDDLCFEVIHSESRPSRGVYQTDVTLRVVGLRGTSVGVDGPSLEGSEVTRKMTFFRSNSLLRYRRWQDSEMFYGTWAKSEDDAHGFLPVRLRRDGNVYLGWVEIRFDGYGNANIVSHSLSEEPANSVRIAAYAPEPAPHAKALSERLYPSEAIQPKVFNNLEISSLDLNAR